MFFNLLIEMNRHHGKVTKRDLAGCLQVSERTIAKYLNGASKISWLDALKIKYTYFPDLEIDYLFATEKDSLQIRTGVSSGHSAEV